MACVDIAESMPSPREEGDICGLCRYSGIHAIANIKHYKISHYKENNNLGGEKCLDFMDVRLK